MSSAEKYQVIKNKMDEIRKESQKMVNNLLIEMSKEIFERHPIVEKFTAHAYQVYFNDGDICPYVVDWDYPLINEETDLRHEWDYLIDKADTSEHDKQICQAAKDIQQTLGIIDDDDIRSIYGNDVAIVFHRNGTIEVESYTDHE